MSTRSLTILESEQGEEIAVLYRHNDGYPSGHGGELASFLEEYEHEHRSINSSVLAVMLIAHFATNSGSFYLHPAGTRDIGEEWIYIVGSRDGLIWLTVLAGCVTYFGMPGTKQENMPIIWQGSPQEFDAEFVTNAMQRIFEATPPPNDFLLSRQSGVES